MAHSEGIAGAGFLTVVSRVYDAMEAFAGRSDRFDDITRWMSERMADRLGASVLLLEAFAIDPDL